MTARMTVLSRLGAGAATIAVFGLLGIAPAGAAAGDTLYTVVAPKTGPYSVSTINPDTLVATPLGAAADVNLSVESVELFGDTGYALGRELTETDDVIEVVMTFDHNTGAILTVVPLDEAFIEAGFKQLRGLDTLADGTLIAVAQFDGVNSPSFVVSINPATGLLTELVDVTGAADFFDSVATDPTTGITYVFVDEDNGDPEFLVVDLDAGTYTGPATLTGIQDSFGDGFVSGADFNSAGSLWFYYRSDGLLLAATSGPFSATVGADFAGGGLVSGDIADQALAVGPPVAVPALAATGVNIVAIGAGAAALLAAGMLGMVIARRRNSTISIA